MKKTLSSVFVSAFLGITLLFILSAIPFTAMNMMDNPVSSGYVYIAIQIIRFLLVIALCWMIRIRSRETLLHTNIDRTKMGWVLLACFVVSILLYMNGTGDRLFWLVSNDLLKIYPRGAVSYTTLRLFLTVMWEQVFSRFFLWGLMLGFAVLLIPFPAKPENTIAA